MTDKHAVDEHDEHKHRKDDKHGHDKHGHPDHHKHGHQKNHGHHGGHADHIYALGVIGAGVYYVKRADEPQEIALGLLKAVVWPATLVYEALTRLDVD